MEWIGVDLDGTLAEYHGWKGELIIGTPIQPMVDRVKRWVAEGKDVRIFTARVAVAWGDRARATLEQIAEQIHAWCLEHIGRALPVTCIKDFGLVEFWDDRCVQVIPNTGLRADGRAE